MGKSLLSLVDGLVFDGVSRDPAEHPVHIEGGVVVGLDGHPPDGARVIEVGGRLIAPGLIETDMNRADIARDDFRQRRLARIPLGEIGVPDDLVAAVVYLASNDEARLVTGASLFIDAGQTIWGA